ncbi:MAG: guanylate kinase [Armatimonadota bacterium]
MRAWDNYIEKNGLLVVLSGPSGTGKDTVYNALEKIYPQVRRCVTTTTRTPRPNEVDGKDYNFVSVEEFRKMVETDSFLEYAQVHGNLYGTPKNWVTEHISNGYDVVLKIDVQGGLSVKRSMPSAIMIFLTTPTFEDLEMRLRSRKTETEEEITKRLLDARKEFEYIPHYDYLVENESVSQAAENIKAVLIAEHCKIKL